MTYGLTPEAQAEVDALAGKVDALGKDVSILKKSLANVDDGVSSMRAESVATWQALTANTDLMQDVKEMLDAGRRERDVPGPSIVRSTQGQIPAPQTKLEPSHA